MDYHGRIMNIQHNPDYAVDRYSCGHKDARHAAAEIVLEAQAEIELLRREVELFKETCVHTRRPEYRQWVSDTCYRVAMMQAEEG